jgi:hypothetical protein
MDKPLSPVVWVLFYALLSAAIVFALLLFLAGLDADRKEKAEYPKFTPTELPVIPSWTPDPEERGKG